VPDFDVSHPNAPSFFMDESNVSKHLSSVVRVAKFVSSGVFRDVKQLKSRLRVVHSAYDGERLHRKRMEVLRQVRLLLARIFQDLCRALNWMRGTVDKANCNVGSLDVIDLGWRVNRLLLSLHLQAESNDDHFVSTLKGLPTGILVAPKAATIAAGASASVGKEVATKLSKTERNDFFCAGATRKALAPPGSGTGTALCFWRSWV
jgi:hypothetical protein